MRIKLTCLLISCVLTVMGQTGYDVDSEAIAPSVEDFDQRLLEWEQNTKLTNECFSNNKYITYPDSVYADRLQSLPTEMELTYNPIVRDHIEKYAKHGRKVVSRMLGEGEHYFPLFEEILDKEGIPLELKYLPIIESALNPTIRSRAGATGLWQFMLATGKNYGLEVNSLVDERCDPAKSTLAAAKYLKDLYYIYDDWNLVIAAYNCGPGNVNKAIRRSGGQTDYWAIYQHLPKETRAYVPAFIAAIYIMNYHSEHNICPLDCKFPSMDSLKINQKLHFRQIANVLDIPMSDLRKYNPQFKNDLIPGNHKEYTLNLPAHKSLAFIDNEDLIYSKTSLNPIRVPKKKTVVKEQVPTKFIKAEEFLAFEQESDAVEMQAQLVTSYHQVERGETLYKIARSNGVTIKELKMWNNLKSNNLKVGSELKIQRIEYVAIEKPKLKEPELLIVSLDHTSTMGVMDNYTKNIETDISMQRAFDNQNAYNQLRLAASINEYEYQTLALAEKNKKKNVFKQLASAAGTAYGAVKNWGESTFYKLRDGIRGEQPDVHLAYLKANKDKPQPIVSENLTIVSTPEENLAGETKTFATNIPSDENFVKIYHKVKIGETVTQIASRYKVKRDDIISWNNLPTGLVKVRQRLLIYAPKAVGLAENQMSYD